MGKALYKSILTKEFLIEEYTNNKKSIYTISKEIEIIPTTVYRYLIKYNIKRRSRSEYPKNFTEEHIRKFREGFDKKCKGKNHYKWKGGRILRRDGYVYIYILNYPNSSEKNHVLEHRLVMEKYLGRYLRPKEVVHHENNIKDDNGIENLKLFKNNAEHTKYHKQKRENTAKAVFNK